MLNFFFRKRINFLLFLQLLLVIHVKQYVYVTKIMEKYDDAYQNQQGLIIDTLPIIQQKLGTVGAYRFPVHIPKNAQITSSSIMLRYNWGTGPGILEIFLEQNSNSSQIGYQPYNITNRNFYPQIVKFSTTANHYGDPITSPDLSHLISKNVNKDNWQKGSHLFFVVFNIQPQTTIETISFEGTSGQLGKYSAQLLIKYQSDQQIIQGPYQSISQQSVDIIGIPEISQALSQQINKCVKQQESLSQKPPLIFVVDDLQTKYLQLISYQIAQLHIQQEVDILLNVIPNNLNSSFLLKYILEYWQKMIPCLVQIGQHGFTHQGQQYQMNLLSYSQQKDIIINGLKALKQVGIVSKSFTPPAGRQNSYTYQILSELGFHTSVDWYRKPEETKNLDIILFENIFLCQNSDGSIIGPQCQIKSYEIIQRQIDEQIQRLDYGCVSFHVQDFADMSGKLDIQKLNKYQQLLKRMKTANKYNFMLPEQYYQLKK